MDNIEDVPATHFGQENITNWGGLDGARQFYKLFGTWLIEGRFYIDPADMSYSKKLNFQTRDPWKELTSRFDK